MSSWQNASQSETDLRLGYCPVVVVCIADARCMIVLQHGWFFDNGSWHEVVWENDGRHGLNPSRDFRHQASSGRLVGDASEDCRPP